MEIDFRRCEFLKGATELRQCPPRGVPEVAFAGRSNAGKSSALNRITGRKGLARASKTPGRTREINFFELADGGRLVDLPGYGFARAPETTRRQWRKMMESYLAKRQDLRGLILLMDVRHPLTDFDRQMLEWSGAVDLPCHLLITKADKLSRGKAGNVLLDVLKRTKHQGGVTAQLFSATTGIGVEEAQAHITAWLLAETPQ
ncbi:MAG: ribosome biogenesis GTP-binding protein YihA/YsxC [Salinisphaeraceae bacterium]|nr:ribosome biogenesis GTP-binding protein YihA/YsxC [Salinisphaeraceae bacterium]